MSLISSLPYFPIMQQTFGTQRRNGGISSSLDLRCHTFPSPTPWYQHRVTCVENKTDQLTKTSMFTHSARCESCSHAPIRMSPIQRKSRLPEHARPVYSKLADTKPSRRRTDPTEPIEPSEHPISPTPNTQHPSPRPANNPFPNVQTSR